MLLSVVVYNHELTLGQWVGAAVVFAGISVEAFVKRKGSLKTFSTQYPAYLLLTDVHAKQVLNEKEKAKIKSL
jgi:UDP-galactose transporter B1